MDNNCLQQDDRRSFARLEYSVPLNFKVCSKDTISRLCAGYSVNISQSGIFCNIAEKVNTDDILWLSFDRATLDFCRELEKSALIYQSGIIGNVTRVEAEDTGGYKIGVRFITRQEKDSGNIYPWIHFFEKSLRMENE
jgi:hypothetical protein